jgi:hypothetical protein
MATTKITIRNNGSVKIEGDFEVVDQEGKAFGLGGRATVALCRCGHSQSKPFRAPSRPSIFPRSPPSLSRKSCKNRLRALRFDRAKGGESTALSTFASFTFSPYLTVEA